MQSRRKPQAPLLPKFVSMASPEICRHDKPAHTNFGNSGAVAFAAIALPDVHYRQRKYQRPSAQQSLRG